jgi:hypothetical protein
MIAVAIAEPPGREFQLDCDRNTSEMGGETKRRQRDRERSLLDHPRWAYCGELAATMDHCPPRCCFRGRHWPEGYVFTPCSGTQDGRRSSKESQIISVPSYRNGLVSGATDKGAPCDRHLGRTVTQ